MQIDLQDFIIFLYTYSAAIWRGVLLSVSLTSNLAPCLIRVLRIYKNETIYTITQVRDTSFSFTNNCYFSIDGNTPGKLSTPISSLKLSQKINPTVISRRLRIFGKSK
jgi:hypothetical protein